MDKEQRRVAKAQLVAGMQTGQAWQTAAAQAGLPISQSNAYRLRNREKTRVKEVAAQAEWQEGAGSLLFLAAAHQTSLLTELQTALSPSLLTANPSLRLAHSQPTTLRCQLLTLLFLEAVGLRRTWDLRSYTGQALALLTGRHLAYGYRHMERF